MAELEVNGRQSSIAGSLVVDMEALLGEAAELLDERMREVLNRLARLERRERNVGLSVREQDAFDELDAWVRRVEDWERTRALVRVTTLRAEALWSPCCAQPAVVVP